MTIKHWLPTVRIPEIPSVCDIWKAAEFNERVKSMISTAYASSASWYAPPLLRNDWVGYPMRKDDDPMDERNPLRMDNEER